MSDYYTQEEMLQFKKPKKKKSLRKKEKLDIDALEAEAKSAGLGLGDLGSRSDGRRQALREEQERNDAEMRSSAYQSALAKADEASKALRLAQNSTTEKDEDDTPVIGDDDDELRKSLDRARKLALKKKDEALTSNPVAMALLVSSSAENKNLASAETSENKVVLTEMELWSRQLDEGLRLNCHFLGRKICFLLGRWVIVVYTRKGEGFLYIFPCWILYKSKEEYIWGFCRFHSLANF